MHPCLLVSVVYWQAGGYLCRQDGENGVTWTVEPVTSCNKNIAHHLLIHIPTTAVYMININTVVSIEYYMYMLLLGILVCCTLYSTGMRWSLITSKFVRDKSLL